MLYVVCKSVRFLQGCKSVFYHTCYFSVISTSLLRHVRSVVAQQLHFKSQGGKTFFCASTAPSAPLGMSTTCCSSVLTPAPLVRLLRTCSHLAAPCCNLSRTRTTWALRVASWPVLMLLTFLWFDPSQHMPLLSVWRPKRRAAPVTRVPCHAASSAEVYVSFCYS